MRISDLATMWAVYAMARDKLSGTKFSFPEIGNSREFSTIPGKFPGIAKSTKILGISRGWIMIYAFNWTNMKNTGVSLGLCLYLGQFYYSFYFY